MHEWHAPHPTRFVNVVFVCAADKCNARSEWLVPMREANNPIAHMFSVSAHVVPDGWELDSSNLEPWCPTHAPNRDAIVEARRQEAWRRQQEVKRQRDAIPHKEGGECGCRGCLDASWAAITSDPNYNSP